MSGFALELDFFVEEYAAHKGQIPPRKRRKKKSLYICTIEKANSVINSLIETKRIENVGLCVVDEVSGIDNYTRYRLQRPLGYYQQIIYCTTSAVSLTTMLKSSVTTSTRLLRAEFGA